MYKYKSSGSYHFKHQKRRLDQLLIFIDKPKFVVFFLSILPISCLKKISCPRYKFSYFASENQISYLISNLSFTKKMIK